MTSYKADPGSNVLRPSTWHTDAEGESIGGGRGGGGGTSADPPNIPPMGPGDHDRITKLEAQYDTLKVVRPMTLTVVAAVLSAIVFAFGFVSFQVAQVNSKVDAIPALLREEFGRMRGEMAAQTSAIANSITAAKQTPPQVIFMPAPQQAPQPPPQPPKQ